MSTDAQFTPPRKKPSVFWWIIGAFFLVLLLFFMQLFGTSPRIEVSPTTTYVTAPLRADGLPDYEVYIRDRGRSGVTPQKNAAAVIWPMVWPGELSPQHCQPVAKELGIDAFPPASAALLPVYKALRNSTPSEKAADDAFDIVTNRPWTSAQFPALAKWAKQYQKQLDTLVEGSKLPRCYFPSPSHLNQEQETICMTLLPGPQSSREAGRSLSARAMWHAGERRLDDAWKDLLATFRIGRLVAQGPTLVEQYVGMAINNMGCASTTAMLHESQPSVDEARRMLDDLSSLPEFSGVADSIDQMERIMFLDYVIAISRGEMGSESLRLMEGDKSLKYLHRIRVDWNVVLKKVNEFHDRATAAARTADRAARRQALANIEDDFQQLERGTNTSSMLAAATNPAVRNEMVAGRLLADYLGFVEIALNAQDYANADLTLTRFAAALALFRAEHGAYPEKLDELIPNIFTSLPGGPYGANTFIYKRIGAGYLLYSTGPNGQDDGGSNGQQKIYQGIPIEQLDDAQADAMKANPILECDDISIRFPLPAVNISPAKSTSNE
jgi:hypothetical protein